MIGRRALLGGAAVLFATGFDCVPASGRTAFRVLRKGSDIGSHVLDFSTSGDLIETHIDIHMAVKFGPFTLFRYRHTGVERSQGNQFVSLDTQTDNDGTPLTVSARRDGDAVIVEATGLARRRFPAGARPLTHWNRACMTAPLFNPQDGKPMRLVVTPRGREMVPLSGGGEVRATHYALTGEGTLDDWYTDDADIWTALRAVAEDGSIIDYRRVVA